MSSAAADEQGRTRYSAYDPFVILGVAGALVCTFLLCLLIWNIHPYSYSSWITRDAHLWVGFFFAPLVMLAWAIVAPLMSDTSSYVWARRLIQLHIVVALCTMLFGCTGLSDALGLYRWFVYGLLAFGSLFVDAAVLAIAPWSKADADSVRVYRLAQLRIAGVTVLAVIFWSFANIALVVAQATYIAAGKPYCILVEGPLLHYKPVSSLMDMNGLKMHTPFSNAGGSGDFQFTFHAVLAVDSGQAVEWRNWSYMQQRFVEFKDKRSWPSGLSKLSPLCERKTNFALQLPVWQ